MSLLAACAPPEDERQALVVQALVRADEVLLRTRPELMEGKFRRMAETPTTFFRGSLPLFVADWEAGRASSSGFLRDTLPVLGLGDPHPENFGLLAGRDGTFTFEPNDFDSVGPVPYLFDVRRLVTGLAVGARQRGPQLDGAALAYVAAAAYADALLAGDPPGAISEPGDSAVLADLFERAREDLGARSELQALTDGAQRFRRGVLDPTEPTALLAEVHPSLAELPAVVSRLASEGSVLDLVRQFGSGVASWPRLRFLVLLQGPTDAASDDVILELKELALAPTAGWYRPWAMAADTPTRVEAGLRRLWSRPDADPRWYTTSWQGLPLQVRTESEAHKGIRVARWSGRRGTQAELEKLAAVLGSVLARVHLASDADALATVRRQLARGPRAFAQEQANFAEVESAQALVDLGHFQRALESLGPRLGVTQDPRELPQGFAREIFGGPP